MPIRYASSMGLMETNLLIAEYSRPSVLRLSTGDLLWMADMPGGEVSVSKLSPDGKVIAIGKKSGEVHLQRFP